MEVDGVNVEVEVEGVKVEEVKGEGVGKEGIEA